MYQKKPQEKLKVANQHINSLFEEAKNVYANFPNEPELAQKLADRYVQIARRIAMKFKIRLLREHKRLFCKHCYQYFRHGTNCRVRNYRNRIVYSCFKCKKFMRIYLR